jgi:hypothetical protein
LKCALNLKSNDSQYTITPYASCGVVGFRQNDIVVWQDDKVSGDMRFGITIDYEGTITSQLTARDFMNAEELEEVDGLDEFNDDVYNEWGYHTEFEEKYGLSEDQELPENVQELNISWVSDKKLELSKMFNNYDSFRELYVSESKLAELNEKIM